ncbi:MAG: ABC transporter ATP-binding protein [Candidatus Melainabacteria bacterium]|nr:ABC transporter ATP-binding protein [Candidatus Melainabacteria bacterium]
MTKLQLKNISKSFGDTKILDDINITVSEGEFIVLVGPSGSGKSTILRIIAGLETPSIGEIEINSKGINNLPPKDRDIAMVFQNYALYPHMNVYENLAFPLKMKNTSKDLIDKAVNETSELLGIKNYLMKKPKELSGGERQRVALGRAIIRKPQLFLMDEPLSNLDAKLRTQMRAELLKLHKTLSSTVIYVTHDQIEALTMGNKIAVLNKGRIQQIGTPNDIYNNPVNTFVAGFIGNPAMNFFDFKLIDDSKVAFLGRVLKLKVKDNLVKSFQEKNLLNKNIILGIRPENISLLSIETRNEQKSGEIIFQATIDLLEMLGNEYLIYANAISPDSKNNKAPFSIKVFENHSYERNIQINVSINLDKAHYFHGDSGARINL